jgi:NAD(P)-dependent dehydrogenase (short-subunit alcohol dehydrogenase family)
LKNSPGNNAVSALWTGISDLFRKQVPVAGMNAIDRIDGLNCLVTGANSGLGKAIAIGLAARGGHVIMACRKDYPEALAEVKRLSGSETVQMERLDLADFDSIRQFCDRLRERGKLLDRVVLNAGVVSNMARRTRQGFEEMFGVNYLANFLLVTRLLCDGTLPNQSFHGEAKPDITPRIVMVSSEAHKSAPAIDFEELGHFHPYGLADSMKEYGKSKLLLTTLAMELSHRLTYGNQTDVSVHALCPGPVNSNIARDTPWWAKPLVYLMSSLFFHSPSQAALPVLFLSCSPVIEGQTGIYLHMTERKEISAFAADPVAGKRLWEISELLVKNGPFS